MIPFFSIVIPAYNSSTQLPFTIASVLNQSFSDFELLLMDDGSTDNTRQVVDSFNDDRIKYSWAENSGGPATPRNRGIDLAKGRWICFLDSDDLWYKDKLAEVYKVVSVDPSIDVVCNDEAKVCNGNNVRQELKYGPFVHDFYRSMLIWGNQCSTSATSVKRSFLKKHNLYFNTSTNFVIVEDYDMWLRIAKKEAKFSFIKKILGEYRIADNNISLNKEKALHNEEVLLHQHVFELQSFSPNTVELWDLVSVRLKIVSIKIEISEKKYLQVFRKLLILITTSSFYKYLFGKLKLAYRPF